MRALFIFYSGVGGCWFQVSVIPWRYPLWGLLPRERVPPVGAGGNSVCDCIALWWPRFFLHIFAYFVHFLILSYIFRCCFVLFWFFWCKIDRVMDGGPPRRPPLISYQFYISKNWKNTKKHLKIHDNMWTYTNIYKIQASVQHGLYLFTCEISSVNSTFIINHMLPHSS